MFSFDEIWEQNIFYEEYINVAFGPSSLNTEQRSDVIRCISMKVLNRVNISDAKGTRDQIL